MTTFIGMAVVDLQRWDRNKRKQLPAIPLLPVEDDNYEEINPLSSVLVYADLIAKKLRDQSWAYRAGNQPTGSRGVHSNPLDNDMLVRYHKNGEIKNKKGKAYQRSCYVCRLYRQTHNTQWACKECNMPLCCTARQGRDLACYREHKELEDINDGCAGVYLDSLIVPAKN
jgi:hypothetical protein